MMIEVSGLDAFYGEAQALFGVGFALDEGQVRTLLGANGAGKTTLLRTLAGLVAAAYGTLLLDGQRDSAERTDRAVARLDVAQLEQRH